MNLSVLIPVGGELETDEWRRRSFDWVRRRYEALLPQAELVYGFCNDEPYNRAKALNDAFEQSTCDTLLIADADTSFNVAQVTKGMTLIRECAAPWSIIYGEERYYNLTEQATEYLLGMPVDAEIDEPPMPMMWDHRITSWSGLVMVPRSAWIKVGGFDERFRSWGGEDNAFQLALDCLIGPFARVHGPAAFCLHLFHPAPEEKCFGSPGWPENKRLLDIYREAATAPEAMRQVISG